MQIPGPLWPLASHLRVDRTFRFGQAPCVPCDANRTLRAAPENKGLRQLLGFPWGEPAAFHRGLSKAKQLELWSRQGKDKTRDQKGWQFRGQGENMGRIQTSACLKQAFCPKRPHLCSLS